MKQVKTAIRPALVLGGIRKPSVTITWRGKEIEVAIEDWHQFKTLIESVNTRVTMAHLMDAEKDL